MDAKEYGLAEQFLKDMLNRSKKYNGNELGNIHNMLGYIAFLKEDFKGCYLRLRTGSGSGRRRYRGP